MTSTHNARSSRHRPNTLMLLVAAAIVAASCADDDDEAEPADSVTTAASPTVTSSAETSATSAETTAAGTTEPTEGTTEVETSTSEATATTVPPRVTPEDAGIVVKSPTCAYRAGEILAIVNDDTDDRVAEVAVGDVVVVADSDFTSGLAIVPVAGDPLEVAQQLVEPEEGVQVVEASPNYIVAFAPGWKYAPFDTPTAYGRQAGGDLSETEVSIAVLDTGFVEVTQEAPPATVAELVTPDVPDLHASTATAELTDGVAAGHGTFIVNMLSQLLPGATITPAAIGARWDHDDRLDVPTPGGQAATVRDDSSVTAALVALAGRGRFDYLNLSFGTYGCTEMIEPFGDVDAEAMAELLPTIPTYLVPLGLRTLLENWGGGGAQVFAASGNDANRPDHPEVFFPAAWARLYDWLYSVASDPIEFDDDPTDDDDYSNRGAWVEHQARGSRVVSRLPVTRQWGAEDWYAWSGTSFATPCALAAHAAGAPALEPASLDENGAYTDCQITAEAP